MYLKLDLSVVKQKAKIRTLDKYIWLCICRFFSRRVHKSMKAMAASRERNGEAGRQGWEGALLIAYPFAPFEFRTMPMLIKCR